MFYSFDGSLMIFVSISLSNIFKVFSSRIPLEFKMRYTWNVFHYWCSLVNLCTRCLTHICAPYVCSQRTEEASDLLELMLVMIVSYHVDAENQTWDLLIISQFS